MISDVLLEILFTVLEEEVKIVCGLLNIEKLHDVGVSKILQRFVFLLHALDKIAEIVFEQFLDAFLLDDLAGEGFLVIFVFKGHEGGSKASPPQARLHFDGVLPNFFVLLLHDYIFNQHKDKALSPAASSSHAIQYPVLHHQSRTSFIWFACFHKDLNASVKYMDINKKIVVCLQCSYFPTKADQFATPSIDIDHQSIQWTCPACQNSNQYPRELVVLPSISCLRLTPQNLLGSLKQPLANRYLVIINSLGISDIAYCVPSNRSLLKTHKVWLGQLRDSNQLAEKSEWLRYYRQKSRGLYKFRNELRKEDQVISKDQYRIYLLETYLKNAASMSWQRGQRQIAVDILLDAKGERFSFELNSLYINQQLIHFFLIYLLGSLDFNPSWLGILYQNIINKHKKILNLAQSYQNLLIFGPQAQLVFLCQQPDPTNFTQLSSKTIDFSSILSKGINFAKYRIEPYLENSFASYLQQKSVISSVPESITVFWVQRRSTAIKNTILTSVSSKIRNMLLNSQQSTDEAILKQALMRELDIVKGTTFLKPIKLFGTFNQKDQVCHVLYTFDWASIESKTMYSSLQEPSYYEDKLIQDIEPEERWNKPTRNPFSKKQKPQSAFLVDRQQAQDEDDGYISL